MLDIFSGATGEVVGVVGMAVLLSIKRSGPDHRGNEQNANATRLR